MTRDDGGLSDDPMYPIAGMSLRDWFAGMALQGWLASFTDDDLVNFDTIGAHVYRIADAMLAERGK